MFPAEDYNENYLPEEHNLKKAKLTKTFSELINRFTELSDSFDAGYVDGDISFFYMNKKAEDAAVFLPFFFENTNFVIHCLTNGEFRLELTEESGTSFIDFSESAALIQRMNSILNEQLIQINAKATSDKPSLKKMFKENTVGLIVYPMPSDDDAILYQITRIQEFLATKNYVLEAENSILVKKESNYSFILNTDHKITLHPTKDGDFVVKSIFGEANTEKTVELANLYRHIHKLF